MKAGSKISSALLLTIAYAFAGFTIYAIYLRGDVLQGGYLYLIALVAVLLLLAGHGLELLRRSQSRRLTTTASKINDVSTNVSFAVWEIFFGWLGLLSALTFLYYAAPAVTLREWYPRLFLCITVFFAATAKRALVFFHSVFPFVLTASILAIYEPRGSEALAETVAKVGFLAIDLGLLLWALRLARSEGVFAVSQFELPVGPGRIGGRLSGVIRNQTRTTPAGGYVLELSCVRQTKEKGKAPTGEVLCHLRKTVRGDLPGARFNTSSVPVDFTLPASALASAAAEEARIAWMLRAEAQLPDTDFNCVFEVPIEQDAPPEGQPRQQALTDAVGGTPPAPGPIGKPNGKSMLFRAAESWNGATELVVAAFFAFWAQLVWLSTAQALGWEQLATFVVGFGFILSLVAPLFRGLECEVTPEFVTVRRRRILGATRKKIALAELEGIDVRPSTVRAGLVDPTQHYSVYLRTKAGKGVEAVASFRERSLAEQAAGEVRSLVVRLAGPRTAFAGDTASSVPASLPRTQLQQA